MLVKGNYHWFPSDFVTWSCWLREIIIDFPQTLSLGHVGYGKWTLISLILCHVVILIKENYHWFPSDFVTLSCWLRKIFIDLLQILSLDYVGYGKLSLISLRLCHLVMLVMVNNHWFPSDYVTWSCWLRLIIIDFPQTLSLGYVGYGKLSLIFLKIVTWSCWLWEIIFDFPQTLPLGHVGYGKCSLISLRLCHLVMLVMGNYHWFPSDFVTWLCWLWESIIDFPQNLSHGHIGYGKLSLISLRLCHLVMLVMLIIIDFPQIVLLGHVCYC